MREMWNGLIYDTDEAELIASWGKRVSSVDGASLPKEETLYKTRNGRFFIVDSYPGEKSLFWRCITGNWGFGKSLRPVGKDDAVAFLFKAGVNPERAGLCKLEMA